VSWAAEAHSFIPSASRCNAICGLFGSRSIKLRE